MCIRDRIRTAFMQLVDYFRFHALAAQVFCSAAGGDNGKAQGNQVSGDGLDVYKRQMTTWASVH